MSRFRHSPTCRKRIEDEMAKSDEGASRLQGATKRQKIKTLQEAKTKGKRSASELLSIGDGCSGGASSECAQHSQGPPKRRQKAQQAEDNCGVSQKPNNILRFLCATPRASLVSDGLQKPGNILALLHATSCSEGCKNPEKPIDASDASAPLVGNPEETCQCYDVLGVPRTALQAEIRHAYRNRALQTHPDKPGGNKTAFIGVSRAFEVLGDGALRREYDLKIIAKGSVDGIRTALRQTMVGTAEQKGPNPTMLCTGFLEVQVATWPALLAVVLDRNLEALLSFLKEPGRWPVVQVRKSTGGPSAVQADGIGNTEEGGAVGGEGDSGDTIHFKSTPGICRAKKSYYAKVNFEKFSILSSITPDLAEAIECHIALFRVKELIAKRRAEGTFDDVVRAAVAEVLAAEQDVLWRLRFTCEVKTKGKPVKRYFLPQVADLELALKNRRTMLDLAEREAPREQLDDAIQEIQRQVGELKNGGAFLCGHQILSGKGLSSSAWAVARRNELRCHAEQELARRRGSVTHLALPCGNSESQNTSRDPGSSGRSLSLATLPAVTPTQLVHKRRTADRMARDVLASADNTHSAVTKDEVLQVLRCWEFARNDSRRNVLPEGRDWVHSDTFGLIRRRDGLHKVCESTVWYPHVPMLLARWLRGNGPPELGDTEFAYTTINVNSAYAARRHRDRNNVGPSVIATFGEFSGGRLRYWRRDPRSGTDVRDLPEEEGEWVDLQARPSGIFDGNCAHEVEDFIGERFSIVYFTVRGYESADESERLELKHWGFAWPDAVQLRDLQRLAVA